jgi:uncharacterized protein (DUF1501 family)
MNNISRRTLLGSMVGLPFLPNLLVQPASAGTAHEGRVLIVVRLMGGNDGLNTLIPVRDDHYYRARPTIGIPSAAALPLAGSDLRLHPRLGAFRTLMEDGHAGIVQGVGYPQPSRSHQRATEIWETGSVAQQAPAQGWLGRHLDDCGCTQHPVAGIQFGDEYSRALASSGDSSRLITDPQSLLELDAARLGRLGDALPGLPQYSAVARANAMLRDAVRQMHRAAAGDGSRHGYPDSEFGNTLRWTGNMIQTQCPTQVYLLRAGSFASGASSFDTHLDQLATHDRLYGELASGIAALVSHLRASGDLARVVLVTYSDFGRQIEENRTGGTEHGEASVMLYAGGSIIPGLRGAAPDLANPSAGGVRYAVDFRSIYADLLANWLAAAPAALPDPAIGNFPIVRG